MNRMSEYKRVSANTDARGPHALQRPLPPLYNSCNIKPSRKSTAGVAPDEAQDGPPESNGRRISNRFGSHYRDIKGGLGVLVERKQTNTQEQVRVMGYIIW